MARNFKKMSTRDLSLVHLDELSTRELKEFIKTSADIMDKGWGTENEQLRKAYNIKSKQLGVRNIHGEQRVKRGYSNLNKQELLERAEHFQSYLAIDYETSEDDYKQIDEKLMAKINKTLGTEFDEDELAAFWFLMHETRNKYRGLDSTVVASMWEEGIDVGADAYDLLHIIDYVYGNAEEFGGLDTRQFMDKVKEILRESFL